MEEGVSPTFATGPVKNQPNSVWKGARVTNLLSRVEIDSNRSRSPPEQPSITLVSTKLSSSQHPYSHADIKRAASYDPASYTIASESKPGYSSKKWLLGEFKEEFIESGCKIDQKGEIARLTSTEPTLNHKLSNSSVGIMMMATGKQLTSQLSMTGHFQRKYLEAKANRLPESRTLIPQWFRHKRSGFLQVQNSNTGPRLILAKSSTVGARDSNDNLSTRQILGKQSANLIKQVTLQPEGSQTDTKMYQPSVQKSQGLKHVSLYLNGAQLCDRKSIMSQSITELPVGEPHRQKALVRKTKYDIRIPGEGRKHKLPQSIVNPGIFTRSRSQPDLEKVPGPLIRRQSLCPSVLEGDSSQQLSSGVGPLLRDLSNLKGAAGAEEGIWERNFNPRILAKTGTSNDTDGLFLVKNYNRYDSHLPDSTPPSRKAGSSKQPSGSYDLLSSWVDRQNPGEEPKAGKLSLKPSEKQILLNFMKSDRSVAQREYLRKLQEQKAQGINFHKPYSKLKSGFRSKTPTLNNDESGIISQGYLPAGDLDKSHATSRPPSQQFLRIDTNLDLEALVRKCSIFEHKRVELPEGLQ